MINFIVINDTVDFPSCGIGKKIQKSGNNCGNNHVMMVIVVTTMTLRAWNK